MFVSAAPGWARMRAGYARTRLGTGYGEGRKAARECERERFEARHEERERRDALYLREPAPDALRAGRLRRRTSRTGNSTGSAQVLTRPSSALRRGRGACGVSGYI